MAEDGLTLTPQCAAGVDTRRRVVRLETENASQWTAINKLRDRPPVWATAVISVLCFGLGAALTWATLMSRIAQAGKIAVK